MKKKAAKKKAVEFDDPTNCPECKVSFKGQRIPKKDVKYFGGATHFSRVVGVYNLQKDRTTDWQCPDCGHTWERT